MHLTDRDRSNLLRFGCTFLAAEHVLYVSWPEERRAEALSASIIARLINGNYETGPVLAIAFEISPTKALPHYRFFPFDPSNETHKEFLASLLSEQKIHLRFWTDNNQVDRTYDILPRHSRKMSELFQVAIASAQTLDSKKYDFATSVAEFEKNLRIVDYFDYIIPDRDLPRIIESIRAKAAAATSEQKELGRGTAHEFLKALQPLFAAGFDKYLERMPSYYRQLLFLTELSDEFGGDYLQVAQFIGDSITANVKQDDLLNHGTLMLLLQSLGTVLGHSIAANTERLSPEQDRELRQILTRRLSGQGISVASLQSAAAMLGVELGGRPGRTGGDYSVEYELKASGNKWREVAEHALQNDPEIRQEFGNRRYGQLDQIEKLRVTHRVKERLRAYAQRTGRPFPPRKSEGQRNSQ